MDCTASSSMRCVILVSSLMAASAMPIAESPSFRFLTPCVNMRESVLRLMEIASPAASSLALLIRCPEARRSETVDRSWVERERLR